MEEKNEVYRLAVLAGQAGDVVPATALAEHLGVPLIGGTEEVPSTGLLLRLENGELFLEGEGLSIKGDFTRMLPRVRKGNLQNELLVRAAHIKGIEHPLVVDATAGLGEDAFLLAAAGFSVRLFECDPVIAALLQNALQRAAMDRSLAPIAARMQLFEADSTTALPGIDPKPDVVLLDPMFPERQKSALVKKKFQLIHQLERPCDAEDALVRAALAAHPRKVVIKRPAKGPYLAGMKPSYTLEGKAIRYDCLVPPKT